MERGNVRDLNADTFVLCVQYLVKDIYMYIHEQSYGNNGREYNININNNTQHLVIILRQIVNQIIKTSR